MIVSVGADTGKRLADLNKVADKLGATGNQVMLAWMLQSDLSVIPCILVLDEPSAVLSPRDSLL